MEKHKMMKKFNIDEAYIDASDDFKSQLGLIKREVVVVVDKEEYRPMAWVRVQNMINVIVYLDSGKDTIGLGSVKYRKEIREILEELGLIKPIEVGIVGEDVLGYELIEGIDFDDLEESSELNFEIKEVDNDDGIEFTIDKDDKN